MSEMKVALKGLTCANCAGKIEDTLSKLSETQEVSINLLRQEMTVKLAPNASTEEMQETVERVVHKFEPEVEVAFLQGQKAEHHHAHHEHCGCGCEEDDDDDDDACRYIHQERRHPYGENAADNTLFHLPETRLQAYDACLLQEVAHHPYHADKLRNDRCRCRAADTPAEVEDEDRGENNVAHHRNHRSQHRFLGIPRGTHDVV